MTFGMGVKPWVTTQAHPF